MKLITLLVSLVLLAGCSDLSLGGATQSQTVPLSESQNCAVGYDLSRAIGENVELRRTVIVSAPNPTRCEEYTLAFLRRAGFAIDGTQRAPNFRVELERSGELEFMATASIGNTLRIARLYRPQAPGVVALSPISVVQMGEEVIWRAVEGDLR